MTWRSNTENVFHSLHKKLLSFNIGADRGSGLTRPFVARTPLTCQDVKPSVEMSPPPLMCHPLREMSLPYDLSPPPLACHYPSDFVMTSCPDLSPPPLSVRCMAMVAAEYLGVWGHISLVVSLFCVHYEVKTCDEPQNIDGQTS